MFRSFLSLLVLVLSFAASSPTATAATITIGTPAGYGYAPFSPLIPLAQRPVERFQQVWDKRNFSGLGPIEITAIQFDVFQRSTVFPPRLPTATYSLSFSTTGKVVNGLNVDRTVAGFDSNLGADNALFNQTVFTGGLAGPLLSFGGSFKYDNSMGNLLLDIQTTNVTFTGSRIEIPGTTNSGGLFSRASYYNRTDNYGMIATFQYNQISPVPLPAGLPLLASGLALFGFTSLRRKDPSKP